MKYGKNGMKKKDMSHGDSMGYGGKHGKDYMEKGMQKEKDMYFGKDTGSKNIMTGKPLKIGRK